jgi:hypothetical protein
VVHQISFINTEQIKAASLEQCKLRNTILIDGMVDIEGLAIFGILTMVLMKSSIT